MSWVDKNYKFKLFKHGGMPAFTLAEVLIALAVIGIVAAVTIPTIVQSYKKRVVETRLAKFYVAINQAIQLSEIEHGDKKTWDKIGVCSKDDEGNVNMSKPNPFSWYEKYLKDYLQVTKVEQDTRGVCSVVLFYNDGSLLSLSANSLYFYPYAKDFGKSGVAKSSVGKMCFTFGYAPNHPSIYHYSKGVEPYAFPWDGTIEQLKNSSDIGCKIGATNEAAYCTKLIQLNGWKIPDDYPFKF